MGSSTEVLRRENLDNLIKNFENSKEKIAVDGALMFNSFELKDQQAVLAVYLRKRPNEFSSPVTDKAACIEEVANLYKAQKCAFEDVLTEQGFEITSEVLKDYSGRIAMLSHYGTVAIFGKQPSNRFVLMTRIHTPECNFNRHYGYFFNDLSLGKGVNFIVMHPRRTTYSSSPLRGLAINPRGGDGDGLEASAKALTAISSRTEVYSKINLYRRR